MLCSTEALLVCTELSNGYPTSQATATLSLNFLQGGPAHEQAAAAPYLINSSPAQQMDLPHAEYTSNQRIAIRENDVLGDQDDCFKSNPVLYARGIGEFVRSMYGETGEP